MLTTGKRVRRLVMMPLVVAASACASTGENAHVPASSQTVSAYLEAAYDGRGQHIMVQNVSSEEIVVTSINLTSCENIRNRCEVRRMRVSVRPGTTERIMTVQPESQSRGSNFRWSWTWEGIAAKQPTIDQ